MRLQATWVAQTRGCRSRSVTVSRQSFTFKLGPQVQMSLSSWPPRSWGSTHTVPARGP